MGPGWDGTHDPWICSQTQSPFCDRLTAQYCATANCICTFQVLNCFVFVCLFVLLLFPSTAMDSHGGQSVHLTKLFPGQA